MIILTAINSISISRKNIKSSHFTYLLDLEVDFEVIEVKDVGEVTTEELELSD